MINGGAPRLAPAPGLPVAVAAQNFLVLDAQWRVIIASATDIWDFLGLAVAIGGTIPEQLQAIVAATVESLQFMTSPDKSVRITPWPSIALSITTVYGRDGALLALSAQRYQIRASLKHAERAYGLSPRELETLRHVLSGAGTSRIAQKLSIADSTVTAHVKSMLIKTKAANRAALVARVLGWDDTPARQ